MVWSTGFLVLLHFTQPVAAAPSFDCAKASTPIEKLICGDKQLGDLDSAVAQAYATNRNALSANEAAAIRQQQRDWLVRRNSECHIPPLDNKPMSESTKQATSCLVRAYRRRLAELFRFELVMSEDDEVCRPLTDVYNELLARQITNATWTRPEEVPLTDFEVTDPEAFAAAGFVEPTPQAKGVLLGATSQIYSTDLFGEGRPRFILLQEYFGPHDIGRYGTYDKLIVLKAGIEPREERRLPPLPFGIQGTSTAIFAPLDASAIDHNAHLTLEGLPTAKSWPIGYLLKKWPRFDTLYSNFMRSKVGPAEPAPFAKLPAIVQPIRQRMFVHKNRTYFVADSYTIVDGIIVEGNSTNSIVLIYEMTEAGPFDTCYVALFPAPLTAPQEGRDHG